jgi:TfoX/Sxy family transcriptional regulator of competence genes
MPYSKLLAERIRHQLGSHHAIEEKKMFGGVGFLQAGNMCVGVWHDSLVARLGPDQAALALNEPYVGEFDITGRPMKGWVLIAPEGLDTDGQLNAWIERALSFVETLPEK